MPPATTFTAAEAHQRPAAVVTAAQSGPVVVIDIDPSRPEGRRVNDALRRAANRRGVLIATTAGPNSLHVVGRGGR